MKYYIGIDNGVTGAVGIISPDGPIFTPTPIRKELDYNKKAKYISRIDVRGLFRIFKENIAVDDAIVYLERPLKNPSLFEPSISACRAFEATLIVLESLHVRYEIIDSKQWQRKLLPKGLKTEALKKASLQVGRRLFPKIADQFTSDADAILIAEYCRRQFIMKDEYREL